MTGDGPKFHIRIHDQVMVEADAGTLKGVALYMELAHFSPDDRVAVTLDGHTLDAPRIRNVAAEDPDNPADVAENSWLVWDLDAAQVDWGEHELQVCVLEHDSRVRPPLVVENVEFCVSYKGNE